MKLAVLGTGMVGSAVAQKLAKLGHNVQLGSRSPNAAKAKALGLTIVSHVEAAAHGEWVVNALPGDNALEYLGPCKLDGKILIDISNYNNAVDQPIETPIWSAP